MIGTFSSTRQGRKHSLLEKKKIGYLQPHHKSVLPPVRPGLQTQHNKSLVTIQFCSCYNNNNDDERDNSDEYKLIMINDSDNENVTVKPVLTP